MVCLGSARFNLFVDVLKEGGAPETHGETPLGTWQYVQDPDSGSVIRQWVADNPATPTSEGGIIAVPCIVRGVLSAGIRGAGTTENFTKIYENVNWAKMTYPASFNITNRDRITNIRQADGTIIWREHDMSNSPATIFHVKGVTPVINPFGRLVEYNALLERAEVQ